MQSKKTFRWLSLLLCLVMVFSLFPMTTLAYNPDYQSETHTVFKHTEQTLAPGITQYTNYAYLNDGEQVVYYVTKSDLSRDDVVAQVAYKDMQCDTYGLDKLSNMVACANAKYSDPNNEAFISENYQVVSATNGDGYNMQTGEPGGAFVMNYQVKKGFAGQFLAIMYDGTARMGYTQADWDSFEAENNGQGIKEAIDIFGSELVRDGVDVTANSSGSYNTDRHSRTMIGITADGELINIVVDGRQSPFSDGASMHELAQIMLEAGAWNAFNLDGGGSTTYMMKPEGSNECVVANRPSDGSERSISNGFIIASTAAPTGVFDHAVLTASEDYVTPNSSFTVSATGADATGGAADLPADLTYQLADASFGSATADGAVTLANDTTGDAVVQAVSGGKVVGETTVHVVIPETFAFDAETYTAPFGKTITLGLVAKYGLSKVTLKPSDVTYAFDPEVGSMDGFAFTSPDDSEITSTTVTATLNWGGLTDTAALTLGQGSVVAYDFEDGIAALRRTNQSNYNYIPTPGGTEIVTAETGKVHSGNYAVKVTNRFDITTEAGYLGGRLALGDKDGNGSWDILDLKGAKRVGFWCYIPDEAVTLNGRIFWCKVTSRNDDGVLDYNDTIDGWYSTTLIDTGGDWNVGFNTQYSESNWHYIYANAPTDTDDWCLAYSAFLDYYLNDRDNTNYNYDHLDYSGQNQNVALYIDDITIDYSSAVDDRDHPVANSITYAVTGMSDAAALENGQEINQNTVSFAAKFSDYAATNTSGLNEASAKAYVDGNPVSFSYNNGLISVPDVALADGAHKVKFSVEDNMGNYNSVIRSFTVNAGTAERSVVVVPHDDDFGRISVGTIDGTEYFVPDCTDLDKIKLGSLYYVDVVPTDDIADVEKVVVDLDLNNNSIWELDHMFVADGFEASYQILDTDDKVAEITITRTGAVAESGQKYLVSIPIRTWQLTDADGDLYFASVGHPNVVWVYPHYKAGSETWPQEIRVKTERGEVTFTDASVVTFSSDDVQVDTESYVWDNATKPADYAAWNGGHDHNKDTGKYYVDQKKTVVTQVGDAEPTTNATSTKGWYGDVGTTTETSTAEDGTVTTVTTTIENTKTYDNHVDGVAMDNQAATCSEVGYTGRTFCTVCNSVVDWGTTVPVVGHSYAVDPADGLMKCESCGEVFSGELDGKLYENGALVNGWVDDCYYADGVKYTGVKAVDGVYYNFGDDGVNQGKYTGLVNVDGVNYYAKFGEPASGWFDVDGEWYYFVPETKAAANGEVTTTDGVTFSFDNGKVLDGVWVTAKNGLKQYWYGPSCYKLTSVNVPYLIKEIDGQTYLFDKNGYVQAGKTVQTHESNSKTLIWYDCNASGAATLKQGPVVFEYLSNLYYADENGQTVPGLGLVKVGDDIYFVGSTGKLVVSATRYVNTEKANGLVPQGYYDFGADGKMIVPQPEVKNGIIDGYYYVNDEIVKDAGLVEVDGDYYYVIYSGKVVVNKTRYVNTEKANGLVPQGYYDFDENGKMIVPQSEVKNGVIDGYYYVNDEIVKDAGLVQVDGDYYYVIYSGKVVVNKTRYVNTEKANGLVPQGYYDFDENGKMIVPQSEVKNGVIDGYYYVNDEIVKDAGLVQVDGDYYYVIYSGKVVMNKTRYVNTEKSNGLVPQGYYDFGEDGKMILP